MKGIILYPWIIPLSRQVVKQSLPMCKLSTYLVVNYLPTYLRTLRDQLFPELITKVKLDINSGKVHP